MIIASKGRRPFGDQRVGAGSFDRQLPVWSSHPNGLFVESSTGGSWPEAPLYGHFPKAVVPFLGSADRLLWSMTPGGPRRRPFSLAVAH